MQAMQDVSAGVRLHKFKAKGTRQETHYFSGKVMSPSVTNSHKLYM